MIRITLERAEHVGSYEIKTIVKEFEDHARAASWLVYDSYFAEPYTLKATWEVIK